MATIEVLKGKLAAQEHRTLDDILEARLAIIEERIDEVDARFDDLTVSA